MATERTFNNMLNQRKTTKTPFKEERDSPKDSKIAKVIREFRAGRLFSSGKRVKDFKQAMAIALSKARRS